MNYFRIRANVAGVARSLTLTQPLQQGARPGQRPDRRATPVAGAARHRQSLLLVHQAHQAVWQDEVEPALAYLGVTPTREINDAIEQLRSSVSKTGT
jgi:hypothetical protein